MMIKMIKSKLPLILIFSIFTLISLLAFFTYKQATTNDKENQEKEKINTFFEISKKQGEETQDQEQTTTDENKSTVRIKENYEGILEIPSINLQKGFYALGSKNNTVNKGLEVINGSQMPDIENSELVIAGHSGNGYLAFFQNLDKVNKGDLIYIYYKGFRYTYQMEETSITDKTGKITVELETDKQSLILTTCNPQNRDKEQLIVISTLKNKEIYK